MRRPFLALSAAVLLLPAFAGAEIRGLFQWPTEVHRVDYRTAADGSVQPAMFYAPAGGEPRPLLVALHSWSHDYRHYFGVPYGNWAVANGWVLVHPHFRGPNVRPDATGSELVIQDVLSAIDHAEQHANVDTSRIYLAGYSSGGLVALLVAARAPERFAGVSVWGAVTDLERWYHETSALGLKYAHDIERSLGGPPLPGSPSLAQARLRSPLTHLHAVRGLPVDLNVGIHDGHGGHEVVPIRHSLDAFNLLAAPEHRLAGLDVDRLTRDAQVPEALRAEATPDPAYGSRAVLFRRTSGATRLTIFEGAHSMLHTAAMSWLSRQRRTTPER